MHFILNAKQYFSTNCDTQKYPMQPIEDLGVCGKIYFENTSESLPSVYVDKYIYIHEFFSLFFCKFYLLCVVSFSADIFC